MSDGHVFIKTLLLSWEGMLITGPVMVILVSGHGLKSGLFKLSHLHTDDSIHQSGEEEEGMKKIECAAKCIKKAFYVKNIEIQRTYE